MQNLTYENEFDFHENEAVGGTHFHMNSFPRRLVLAQSYKATRKWPIKRTVRDIFSTNFDFPRT